MSSIKKLLSEEEEEPKVNDVCPECNDYYPDDERVKAGMKCGYCAYSGEMYADHFGIEERTQLKDVDLSLTDVMPPDTIVESKSGRCE